MITRSQATKARKNVPVRSARSMQRLLAKKQQVQEEQQLRVQAKKKGRAQKQKAGLGRKAKSTRSSSTAQPTCRTQTSSFIQTSSSTQTSPQGQRSSSTQTSPQGQRSSSSLPGPGRFALGLRCAPGYPGPRGHTLPCPGTPPVMVPEGKEGRNDPQNGRLNPDGEDLCDCLVRDCPGCFEQCPTCQSTKCGPLCRQNRICVYEVFADNEGQVISTFSLPHAK
ncbi:uncharacterized protein LOC123255784 [Gracilinanus agilis]|uniref:uncharacterized protein LOC123255784 n=1 Tax=Gracilinanus agilis TaxID=191870 RepID=UPI001CFD2931|nr:uncharacterized protein LOC123255784 [Gracilinanus agilis]